jgi:putative ABC transport system permease protein
VDFLARFDATIDALAAVPGVRSVSSVRRFPFRGTGEGFRWNHLEDADDVEGTRANLLQVSPRFFETMGIPLTDGGEFDPADIASGRPVVIVGQSIAGVAFPGERAVGRSLRVAGEELQIVGVVPDIRQTDLRGDPTGVVYIPNPLSPRRAAAFVVRSERGAGDPIQAVRAAMQRLDADQPITELALASDIVDEELGRDRFLTLLIGLFAGLALTLSSVGVYAVVAFGVSRRRREVGIRLALGAEPANVRALVVRQGMVPVVVGIVIGVALSLASSGVLKRVVFSVEGFQPMAYAGTAALLGLVGFMACWLPARSAGSRAIESLAQE